MRAPILTERSGEEKEKEEEVSLVLPIRPEGMDWDVHLSNIEG